MGKIKKEYIVDSKTGEVIWISFNVKNILCAYFLIGYDKEKNMFFFNTRKREQILEIIRYEETLAT